MKRLLMLVSMLCVVGAAAARSAAAVGGVTPQIRFGVHGDFTLGSLPGPAIDGAKPLQDAYEPGYGGGAHLDVNFATLGFRLSGDYVKYSLDEGRFRDSYRGSSARRWTSSRWMAAGSASLRSRPAERWASCPCPWCVRT